MSTTNEERQVEAIAAQNNLTQAVATWQSGIAAERAREKADFEAWKGSLEVESRVVQDITITGSPDYFYPVWWKFPSNGFGVAKIIISRSYYWNRSNAHSDFHNPSPAHIGSLLLELQGNDIPWGGDAKFLQVVRFFERYNVFASHLQFGHYCFREGIDGGAPDYGGDGTNYCYSGVFLRGGNITYRFTSNWNVSLNYQNGSDGVNHKATLHRYLNTRFYTKPMPLTDRVAPVVG